MIENSYPLPLLNHRSLKFLREIAFNLLFHIKLCITVYNLQYLLEFTMDRRFNNSYIELHNSTPDILLNKKCNSCVNNCKQHKLSVVVFCPSFKVAQGNHASSSPWGGRFFYLVIGHLLLVIGFDKEVCMCPVSTKECRKLKIRFLKEFLAAIILRIWLLIWCFILHFVIITKTGC